MDLHKYDALEPYLQKLNTLIVQSKSNENYKSMQEFMIEFHSRLMRSNIIFQHYKGVQCTGSYLHKNFIGKPDEFDMNLIVKLPIDYNSIAIESSIPGYVKINLSREWYKVTKSSHLIDYKSCISKWISSDNYILQSKFRQWMEGEIDKVLYSLVDPVYASKFILTCDNGIYCIKPRKSGPAFTLSVKKLHSDISFDIDLVPVLIFTNQLPYVNLNNFCHRDWYAVAKPFFSDEQQSEYNKMWRLSFPLQENEMWIGNYNMKPVSRLLKQLRSIGNMNYIASYYINTVLLHINKEDSNIWMSRSLSWNFMNALKKIYIMICNKNIPYYWIPYHNLLCNLTSHQIEDCQRTLYRYLNTIEKNYSKNPSIIIEILFPTTEGSSNSSDSVEEYRTPVVNTENGLGLGVGRTVAAITAIGAISAIAFLYRNRIQN